MKVSSKRCWKRFVVSIIPFSFHVPLPGRVEISSVHSPSFETTTLAWNRRSTETLLIAAAYSTVVVVVVVACPAIRGGRFAVCHIPFGSPFHVDLIFVVFWRVRNSRRPCVVVKVRNRRCSESRSVAPVAKGHKSGTRRMLHTTTD